MPDGRRKSLLALVIGFQGVGHLVTDKGCYVVGGKELTE